MQDEMILGNARIVLADRVARGTVMVRGGVIADISEGATLPPGALDCEGDYLLPGLVETHTDNLERHLRPRPGVDWPRRAAVAAHDCEFAAAGATTLLDALRLGSPDESDLAEHALEAATAIAQLRDSDLLRADHHLHLRCEVAARNLDSDLARFGESDRVRLISMMDHTPGQRQFHSIDAYLSWRAELRAQGPETVAAHLAEMQELQAICAGPNRVLLADRAERSGAVLASHDDASGAHVAESAALGATIAEFPTTLEAARASRAAGMKIVMGAPNILRGCSHSGNVSALDLAREGLVDIISSDYAPAALLLAMFKLAEEVEGWDIPRACACVTSTSARAVGFTDRGEIAVGMRADLARVLHVERLSVTRGLWRAGRRVL